DVGRLGVLVADGRVEVLEHAAAGLELGGRRVGLHAQGHAAHAVALAEPGGLVEGGAVVVDGGAPEHAAVRHHALVDLEVDLGVAVGGAAADVADAQVVGVDEPDEVGRLVVEGGVGADGVGGGGPHLGVQVGRGRWAAARAVV